MKTEYSDKLKVVDEFSRFAKKYDKYSIIQSKVVSKLVDSLAGCRYHRMIDVGCGSGALYKKLIDIDIFFEHFTALDASSNMLDMHPNEKRIEKLCVDFNNTQMLDELSDNRYDLLLSSSSLQWCTDFDLTVSYISRIAKEAHLAIFSSGTFKTLHETAGISSPIYSTGELSKVLTKYYDISTEIVKYELYFKSTIEMLQYIKNSGVSGGRKILGYKETKQLIKNYPLEYLEFEVMFVRATPIKRSS